MLSWVGGLLLDGLHACFVGASAVRLCVHGSSLCCCSDNSMAIGSIEFIKLLVQTADKIHGLKVVRQSSGVAERGTHW